MKYIPKGAIGDQEEMAQLDGEQVLCCGPEAPASFTGEQWCEWRNAAVNPQQEQLADPDVQPAGRDPCDLNATSGDNGKLARPNLILMTASPTHSKTHTLTYTQSKP